MKKLIAILTVTILLICLVGCEEPPTVVSEKPIDTDFIAAHNTMETKYKYKYDWINGKYRLLPVYVEVSYPDTYKVQYEITYSDGSTETDWRKVDKPTYEKTLKDLGTESEETKR